MQTKILEAPLTKHSTDWYARRGKRSLDIIISLIGIILISPIFFFAGIAIALTSRGPIILRQQRVGKDGELFTMMKFRTMRNIADNALKEHVNTLAASGVLYKVDRDPRLTKVGVFIRRYSIDELPQLFNILKGDMSLVGPRPLLPFMVAPHPSENRLRTIVLPGLTGLWQISARGESNSVLQMIHYDIEYQKDISCRNDLRILLRTIPNTLKGTGVK